MLPMTQVAAAAVCHFSGLVSLQNHPKLVTKHLALIANGVWNVVPNRLFAVTMSNFGDKPTGLPKGRLGGITLPTPVATMKAWAVVIPSDTKLVANWEHEVILGEKVEPHKKSYQSPE